MLPSRLLIFMLLSLPPLRALSKIGHNLTSVDDLELQDLDESTGVQNPCRRRFEIQPIRARVGLIGDLKFWFSQHSDPRGCTRRSIPPTIGWSCLEILVRMNNKTVCKVMHSVYQMPHPSSTIGHSNTIKSPLKPHLCPYGG